MKSVILSADGDSVVYGVPDQVAEHLEEYCIHFCDHWLRTSPHAQKYRFKEGPAEPQGEQGFCYNEADFIEYLNQYVFPEEPSVMIENLGWIEWEKDLPEKYRELPYFNF